MRRLQLDEPMFHQETHHYNYDARREALAQAIALAKEDATTEEILIAAAAYLGWLEGRP